MRNDDRLLNLRPGALVLESRDVAIRRARELVAKYVPKDADLIGELIAERAQLQGLEQIYMAENVRVRGGKARIGELERQLAKITGQQPQLSDDKTVGDWLHPSIRTLPLLGTTYADLYRRARVQQVIFETLTKQYELVKVEEAEDMPSVSVLDRAEVSGRKTGPARGAWIVVAGAFCFVLGGLVVLVESYWSRMADTHPAKIFNSDVRARIHTDKFWGCRLLSFGLTMAASAWLRLRFGRAVPNYQH